MTHLATINRNSDPSPVAALTVAQLDSHGTPSADVFSQHGAGLILARSSPYARLSLPEM
jgi:hypothetical protein